jgi:hypothetical protein
MEQIFILSFKHVNWKNISSHVTGAFENAQTINALPKGSISWKRIGILDEDISSSRNLSSNSDYYLIETFFFRKFYKMFSFVRSN